MHISLKLLIIILRCSKSALVWYSSGYLYFTFDFYKDDRIHILYEQHIKTHKYQQLHQHQFLNIKISNLIRDPDTDLANHTWYQFWPSVLVSYWQNSCNQLIGLIEMLLLLTLSHLNSSNQDFRSEFLSRYLRTDPDLIACIQGGKPSIDFA